MSEQTWVTVWVAGQKRFLPIGAFDRAMRRGWIANNGRLRRAEMSEKHWTRAREELGEDFTNYNPSLPTLEVGRIRFGRLKPKAD